MKLLVTSSQKRKKTKISKILCIAKFAKEMFIRVNSREEAKNNEVIGTTTTISH